MYMCTSLHQCATLLHFRITARVSNKKSFKFDYIKKIEFELPISDKKKKKSNLIIFVNGIA